MSVADYCTAKVETLQPDASAAEAARVMRDHGIGSVVVPTPSGPGIVTDRDLVVLVLAERRDPKTLRFAELPARMRACEDDPARERAAMRAAFERYCEVRAALGKVVPDAYFTHQLDLDWGADEARVTRWIDLAVDVAEGEKIREILEARRRASARGRSWRAGGPCPQSTTRAACRSGPAAQRTDEPCRSTIAPMPAASSPTSSRHMPAERTWWCSRSPAAAFRSRMRWRLRCGRRSTCSSCAA